MVVRLPVLQPCMACHSPLKLCIHVAPSDYDWGEPCHPNAIMTRVLAATSWDPASPLNSCLVNEGSWRQRTIGHQWRRGARAQPQPCLTLDTAPAQQAHVNLLFKCPAITFSIGNAGEKWFCFEIHPQNKVLLGLYFCLFGACLRGKQRLWPWASWQPAVTTYGAADTKISVDLPPEKAAWEPESQWNNQNYRSSNEVRLEVVWS